MTLGQLKELCEEWTIDDDAKLKFGVAKETYEVTDFWFMDGAIIFDNKTERESHKPNPQLCNDGRADSNDNG